jgi:hypothetical protein
MLANETFARTKEIEQATLSGIRGPKDGQFDTSAKDFSSATVRQMQADAFYDHLGTNAGLKLSEYQS